MARDDTPPLTRGETYYNGGTIDANDLGGVNLEGKEFVFEDNDPRSLNQADGTGRPVTTRVVRNVSGITLKPGRLVKYSAIDPYETRVDGYTFAVGDRPAGTVDEYLPPAGVPNNDLFNLVVDGPSRGIQLSATAATLAIGDRLVPGTGTSATNDDAGRIAKQDVTGSAATLANNVQNVIGFAGQVDASTENASVKIVLHLAGS